MRIFQISRGGGGGGVNIPYIKLSQGRFKKQRRSIVFGTYDALKNEIKIHPILLESVPEIALEFVIYHELLHFMERDILLVRKKKMRVHTKEFRQQEKKFFHYDKAQKILKDLLYNREISYVDRLSLEEQITASVDNDNLDKILTYYKNKQ
ncbi:hypothetical protein SAMN02745150_00754 [Brevinema andersonii]|uniref:SprT-like domain-containing protein n=1 Tax=Brevinema andersonii TaxID=34097 RepID=A0A1I1DZ48_BREAD|nr:hypothetical protein [Brevinema andersonii]SFB78000.1 hypothetical protein SAMN02745150_00754 [Brevinema andersonii]